MQKRLKRDGLLILTREPQEARCLFQTMMDATDKYMIYLKTDTKKGIYQGIV